MYNFRFMKQYLILFKKKKITGLQSNNMDASIFIPFFFNHTLPHKFEALSLPMPVETYEKEVLILHVLLNCVMQNIYVQSVQNKTKCYSFYNGIWKLHTYTISISTNL